MFLAIVLLLFIGILLLVLEIVVPFGLSFIAGLGVIGFSTYLCFQYFPPGLATLYLIGAIIASGACAYYIYRSGIRWTALSPPRSFRAKQAQASQAQERPQVGEIIKVIQPLRPTGTVLWRNHRFPARSLQPECETEVDALVEVKGYDSIYLLVNPTDSSVHPVKEH